MAEFEELVLQVRVDDQGATAKLDQLKRSVADLGGGSQAAGYERFKRQTDEINEALQRPDRNPDEGASGPSGEQRVDLAMNAIEAVQ